jgi:acyl-CoA synthetase (AMP-forming)/AMP-acid ligase II
MNYNITHRFINYANNNPGKPAIVIPEEYNENEILKEKIVTFSDMAQLISQYENGLRSHGYKKGDKIIMLTPVNLEFYACMMAMLNIGIVAVFLDPGIGLKKILHCVKDSKAKGIISVDRLLKFWPLIFSLWFKDKFSSDKKRKGISLLESLKSDIVSDLIPTALDATDHVLVTYTSGSTGKPKAADRNAKNVFNQLNFISKVWDCNEDVIDFPSFPMFGFMNLLYGVTTVLPAIDFRNVGDVNPSVIVEQMKKWKVTRTCGAFTFNSKIINYLKSNDEKIPTLKNMVLGGTPVTKSFCKKLENVYPNAECNIVYGSTEVAPISYINVNELLDSNGKGCLVGHAFDEVQIAVVDLPEVIEEFDEREEFPYVCLEDQCGEVIVKAPHVVQSYINDQKGTSANKIKSLDGEVWHRTGDTGYLDDDNRLWLVGRTSDIITTQDGIIHPYPIEMKLDELVTIRRSALVEVNNRKVLAVECDNLDSVYQEMLKTLKSLGLSDVIIKCINKIPLDDRHNSKIDRIKLKTLVG